MLVNETTSLYSERLVLRPYRRWHVPRYHEWMQDEALREQTASERLTYDQEEEMQRALHPPSPALVTTESMPPDRN